MFIYQAQRTMSSDTLVGANGNNSKVDLNTPTNGDTTFNFQIIQKPAAGRSIANDLTGNTLQVSKPETPAFQDSSLLEEMLNNGTTLGDELRRPTELTEHSRLPQMQEYRRLSISEYNSTKPVYYEYEFFEKGLADRNEEEDIMITDDEGPDTFSFSPRRQLRKDSVFSDYGNEMVMNLSPETLLSHLPGSHQQQPSLEDNQDFKTQELIRLTGGDGQCKKKVKDYFKLNFFSGPRSPDILTDPEIFEEEPQPFLRKKYFWSRKPTIPISGRDSLSLIEPVVNPSKLLNSNDIDTHRNLGTSLTDFSGSETTPGSPEPNIDIGVVKKKRLGFPKTRGRKPSPILDSSKHFACEFCDRRFKRQEHLKRHVRSLHMGEKPFGCHLCGKKFSRSDNLNQHIKTHPEDELS
ncbi:LANO_0F08460g1_1 [Lachancea nothofagi CBS 11611]|uniref:LANO_0F08460g1_1 n=1 Tax=Lachancea nothofagi CBS 11611 TaxID=1266666 RepID=A0A1G4K9E3_9SACH|nr:LANO_0F08460g1_1 [Lachancea nothofagi CBS 11611]